MKTWHVLAIALALVAGNPLVVAQKTAGPTVPKYDRSAEAVFKGTIDDVHDRQCPVTGGVGTHLTLKQPDGSLIEVHLALSRFVRQYELVFKKGDVVEITGVKVKFEGADTILARKIKRGDDEFLFRDTDGKPLW
jgi:DNA/RNA endonuclease YhcR with UshA esterase domain